MRFKGPFEVEEYRDKLAREGKLGTFKQTYTSTYPYIKADNSGRFWNKKHDVEGRSQLESPMVLDRLHTIETWLGRFSGRLLDVGFGYGHLEERLEQRENLEVFGIDVSGFSVVRAKGVLKGSFKKGNILDISFPKEYFDILICLEILEHISAIKTFKALKECRRVLKKGGTFVVSVPMNEGLEQMLKQGKNPNGHCRAYTKNILFAELECAGFKIIKHKLLYAFRNYYLFKSLFINYLGYPKRQPNNLVVLSVKQ